MVVVEGAALLPPLFSLAVPGRVMYRPARPSQSGTSQLEPCPDVESRASVMPMPLPALTHPAETRRVLALPSHGDPRHVLSCLRHVWTRHAAESRAVPCTDTSRSAVTRLTKTWGAFLGAKHLLSTRRHALLPVGPVRMSLCVRLVELLDRLTSRRNRQLRPYSVEDVRRDELGRIAKQDCGAGEPTEPRPSVAEALVHASLQRDQVDGVRVEDRQVELEFRDDLPVGEARACADDTALADTHTFAGVERPGLPHRVCVTRTHVEKRCLLGDRDDATDDMLAELMPGRGLLETPDDIPGRDVRLRLRTFRPCVVQPVPATDELAATDLLMVPLRLLALARQLGERARVRVDRVGEPLVMHEQRAAVGACGAVERHADACHRVTSLSPGACAVAAGPRHIPVVRRQDYNKRTDRVKVAA